MREIDDAALELQLGRVLTERLGSLPMELTVEAIERRRAIRDATRRRRRTIVGLGLAAALVLPAGWLAAGAPMPQPPAPPAVVVAPAPSPAATPGVSRPVVEELGRSATGQLSAFGSALLADDRVLLVGGADTTVGQVTQAKAWLWDPTTKRIVPTGAMTTPRADPLAVTLLDSRVLVIGGWREDAGSGVQSSLSTAELFDPTTGRFTATQAMPNARRDCPCGALNRLPFALQRSTVLHDGRVFVAGGDASGGPGRGSTAADVFDPATERWSQLDIGCDAARGTQALLKDGRLLIVCVDEHGDVRARLFDPVTNAFTEAAKPPAADSMATTLPDGRILLTGREPIVYDPAADAFESLPPGRRPDAGQAGIVVGPASVLFLGDPTSGRPTLTFDPTSGRFTVLGHAGFADADAVVPLRDGRILTVAYQMEARLLDPGQVP